MIFLVTFEELAVQVWLIDDYFSVSENLSSFFFFDKGFVENWMISDDNSVFLSSMHYYQRMKIPLGKIIKLEGNQENDLFRLFKQEPI